MIQVWFELLYLLHSYQTNQSELFFRIIHTYVYFSHTWLIKEILNNPTLKSNDHFKMKLYVLITLLFVFWKNIFANNQCDVLKGILEIDPRQCCIHPPIVPQPIFDSCQRKHSDEQTSVKWVIRFHYTCKVS